MAMITWDEIKSQFSEIGITPSDDIYDTCFEICQRQNLDAETLVDCWIAFTSSAFQKSSLEPTKSLLLDMEKKEFEKMNSTPKRAKTERSILGKNIVKTPGLETTPTRQKPHLNFDKNSSKSFSPVHHSPKNASPKMDITTKYSSGEVITNFGSSVCDWESKNCSYHLDLYSEETCKNPWKFMFDSLYSCERARQEIYLGLAEKVIANNDLKMPQQLDAPSFTEGVFVGCVGTNGSRISAENVIVNGVEPLCSGKVILAVSDVEDFAVFPGQVIAFEGTRRGKKIIASKIFSNCQGFLPGNPNLLEILQIVVAAGPFSTSSSLLYEPLNDILQYCVKHAPHCLFLIGPLIDLNNQMIDGEIDANIYELQKELFQRISSTLKNVRTTVYIISSAKDVLCPPVYPTSPLVLSEGTTSKIHVLPDPALINLDGLIIGLTSVDSILHLSKKEVSKCRNNRLARLTQHLVNQQSFYPLLSGESETPVDRVLWKYKASIPVVPHLLIIPSDLHQFIKIVDRTLMLNPERAVKGFTSGFFACIEARPSEGDEIWTASTHLSSKIVKI